MAKKKSIRVDFVKSCITYNKLNTIAKIAISGIENICKPHIQYRILQHALKKTFYLMVFWKVLQTFR